MFQQYINRFGQTITAATQEARYRNLLADWKEHYGDADHFIINDGRRVDREESCLWFATYDKPQTGEEEEVFEGESIPGDPGIWRQALEDFRVFDGPDPRKVKR